MNQNQWNRNTMRLKFKWHQVSLKEFDFPMVHSDINALQCVNIDGMNAIINICDGFCHRPNFWLSDAMTQFEFDCVRAWIISRCVLCQSFRSDCNLATEIAGNCSHVSFQPPLFSDRLREDPNTLTPPPFCPNSDWNPPRTQPGTLGLFFLGHFLPFCRVVCFRKR